MTTRYLNLTTPKGALSVQLPDEEWIDNPTAGPDNAKQLQDVFLLGESLRRILRGRRGRQLEAIASLSEHDGQAVPVQIQYGYDPEKLRLCGIRFLREPAYGHEDILVEFDLDTRCVRFGETRWS
jgi:hypothetical protein